MRKVIIESPFAGDIEANIKYARAALRDCLGRNESPLASHLLYTQEGVLNDDVPDERDLGIWAGLAWVTSADAVVVYQDLGISKGMKQAIHHANIHKVPVEYRNLSSGATLD